MNVTQHFTDAQKHTFFSLVADEWQEDFDVLEKKYLPEIFLGLEGDDVVAGMALFTERIPESEKMLKACREYLDYDGYIGYFVVNKAFRGQGIGSRFLTDFLAQFPEKRFWLVIENLALQAFYEKNGFEVVQTVGDEKVMVRVL